MFYYLVNCFTNVTYMKLAGVILHALYILSHLLSFCQLLRGVLQSLATIVNFSICLFNSLSFCFFGFLNKFIYLFLAVLGLPFCARAFSSCGKQGPLFIAVRGPVTVAASPVAEHRLQTRRLSSCGSRA